ncbi:hypothetical protein L3V82_13150 [Thiotrichales bacterium 19S3-7]|nr:hypothetical protein [Thiotrichales bacterium 19S3-7]MCF6803116.1 hypothetical protein [Thiotrichales bacterium 19S3-11]
MKLIDIIQNNTDNVCLVAENHLFQLAKKEIIKSIDEGTFPKDVCVLVEGLTLNKKNLNLDTTSELYLNYLGKNGNSIVGTENEKTFHPDAFESAESLYEVIKPYIGSKIYDEKKLANGGYEITTVDEAFNSNKLDFEHLRIIFAGDDNLINGLRDPSYDREVTTQINQLISENPQQKILLVCGANHINGIYSKLESSHTVQPVVMQPDLDEGRFSNIQFPEKTMTAEGSPVNNNEFLFYSEQYKEKDNKNSYARSCNIL